MPNGAASLSSARSTQAGYSQPQKVWHCYVDVKHPDTQAAAACNANTPARPQARRDQGHHSKAKGAASANAVSNRSSMRATPQRSLHPGIHLDDRHQHGEQQCLNLLRSLRPTGLDGMQNSFNKISGLITLEWMSTWCSWKGGTGVVFRQ